MPITTPINRRQFLVKTLTAAGLSFGYQTWIGAEESAASDRVVLLSDIHISQDPARVLRDTNMAKNLEQAVSEIVKSLETSKSKALCITGDIALSQGLVEDYQEVKRLLSPLNDKDLPVHLLMGNHDHRGNCQQVMGNYQPQGVVLQPQIASKISLKHVNLYLLDSLVKTNYTPGEIGAAQLAWLEKELAQDSSKASVVLVHHNLRFDDNKNALTDTEGLFGLAKKYANLKGFIYGHSHHWDLVEKEGRHLVNLPPVSYVFSEKLPNGWVDAEFFPDRMELTLHTIHKDHELNDSKYELKWN